MKAKRTTVWIVAVGAALLLLFILWHLQNLHRDRTPSQTEQTALSETEVKEILNLLELPSDLRVIGMHAALYIESTDSSLVVQLRIPKEQCATIVERTWMGSSRSTLERFPWREVLPILDLCSGGPGTPPTRAQGEEAFGRPGRPRETWGCRLRGNGALRDLVFVRISSYPGLPVDIVKIMMVGREIDKPRGPARTHMFERWAGTFDGEGRGKGRDAAAGRE